MSTTGVCLFFHLFTFLFFSALPHGMWDLSSPTRARTHAPCVEAQSLNHWTSREVPYSLLFKKYIFSEAGIDE